jgi:hypothetical protein
MSAYGTKLAEGFSQRLMKQMYDISLVDAIVNRDYEGEINKVGSKLNILNFDEITEKTYANSQMTADSLTENNAQLIIDTYKSFYWKEKVLAKWLSYIKDPHATIVDQVSKLRAKNMDTFVFGGYADVGAGNRVGTDYTTGTVTVTVTSGAVVGSGTTFTEGMVGRGFKALGHTKWYRVATFTDTTHITIEDDLDDVDSVYSGGAIAGGATYTIEAATPLAITTSNLLTEIAALKLKLDSAEANGHNAVPDTDRWLIVPPNFETILVRATGVALHVPEVYSELVKRGFITELLGFKVFKSNRLTGNNTDGWRVLAGHPNWMTFAETVLNVRMEEDLPGDFGTAYKDLFVYGKKVTDTRRHMAAEGYFTF